MPEGSTEQDWEKGFYPKQTQPTQIPIKWRGTAALRHSSGENIKDHKAETSAQLIINLPPLWQQKQETH